MLRKMRAVSACILWLVVLQSMAIGTLATAGTRGSMNIGIVDLTKHPTTLNSIHSPAFAEAIHRMQYKQVHPVASVPDAVLPSKDHTEQASHVSDPTASKDRLNTAANKAVEHQADPQNLAVHPPVANPDESTKKDAVPIANKDVKTDELDVVHQPIFTDTGTVHQGDKIVQVPMDVALRATQGTVDEKAALLDLDTDTDVGTKPLLTVQTLDHVDTAVHTRADDTQAPVKRAVHAPGQLGQAPLLHQKSPVSVLYVLVMTFLMALAGGLGAAPYFFISKLPQLWAGLANAIACGVMVAASFDLLHEGEEHGALPLLFGLVTGCLFIKLMQEWLHKFEDVRFEGMTGANAQKAMLVVGIMAAHAIGEGSGVGVSFCGARGHTHGVLVTLAIGLHNIPEGLAVATVMVAKGARPRAAAIWAILCCMPQPLFAVPAFVFVDSFRACLPFSMGFASGCMIWIVFAELLPDALEDASAGPVATSATLAAGGLEALRLGLKQLEQPDGVLALVTPGSPAAVFPPVAAASVAVVAAGVTAALVAAAPRSNVLFSGSAVGSHVMTMIIAAGGILWRHSATCESSIAFQYQPDPGVSGMLAVVGGSLVWLFWRRVVKQLRDAVHSRGHLPAFDRHLAARETGTICSSQSDSWDMLPESGSRAVQFERTDKKSDGSRAPQSPLSMAMRMEPLLSESQAPWTAVMSSSVLCICMLVGHAIVTGSQAAATVATETSGAVGRLMLPLALAAIPPALTAAALSPSVFGTNPNAAIALATGIASLVPITMAIELLIYPTGVVRLVPERFDTSGLIGVASALLIGASCVAFTRSLWPVIRSQHKQHVIAQGAMLGAGLALVLSVMSGLLCLGTTYCLCGE